MSYNQPNGLLVIPLSQSCMAMSGRKLEIDRTARAAPARIGGSSRCPAVTATSDELAAFDVKTMKELWSREQRSPFLTGVSRPRAASALSAISIAPSAPSTSRPARRSGRRGSATTVQGYPVTFSVGGTPVRRGHDRRIERRQPARRAAHDRAGSQVAANRQRALRLRVARQKVTPPQRRPDCISFAIFSTSAQTRSRLPLQILPICSSV